MRKLPCDPTTLAGPIDYRVVKELEMQFGKLESDYIDFLENHHGGVLEGVSIDVDSKQYPIARFLTLIDRDSKLEGDIRPHFMADEVDERVFDGVDLLVNGEHMTARGLHGVLFPFAATQVEMILQRSYVDLFCFDFRNKQTPTVVLWLSKECNKSYIDWERLPIEERYEEYDNPVSLPWENFIVPVADSFGEFLNMLEVSST